jgi:hypothetical protein
MISACEEVAAPMRARVASFFKGDAKTGLVAAVGGFFIENGGMEGVDLPQLMKVLT